MGVSELTTAGEMPALEALMRFAAARHRVISHNLANISTPNFVPQDVSVAGFQTQLRDAIERRRGAQGTSGTLRLAGSREVRQEGDGRLTLTPRSVGEGILYHDRNNRDLERTLQDLVENTTAFRVASDLLKSRYDLLRSAIAERVG